MTQEQIEKLKGVELNKTVAQEVMGWELLTVGYCGDDSETPRQRELEKWLDKLNVHSVGDYWINVSENFIIDVEMFFPTQDWRDMVDVVSKLRENLGFSVQLLFEHPYMPNARIINKQKVMVANQYDKSIGIALCRAALLAVQSRNE